MKADVVRSIYNQLGGEWPEATEYENAFMGTPSGDIA